MPAPAPAAPVEPGRRPATPLLNEANLIEAAQSAVSRLQSCCMHVQRRDDSINWLEALAIVSAAVLSQVDVIIESGVASGFSSEVWARYFEGTPTRIYAIDSDAEGRNDVPLAAQRLKPFPKVKFIAGDSWKHAPQLLNELRGQRIGVFIDGPKLQHGTWLGLNLIALSSDVKFVAQHDTVEAALLSKEFYDGMASWNRTVLRTWMPAWRKHFSRLDNCSVDTNCGWGILIMAGIETLPMTRTVMAEFRSLNPGASKR
mmetsp:Transcript_101646/g.263370  ORF Transcript_101646/g.263370 Transcript_101646/m.263370 type:complete len:258 (+) Transcript_101646:2-775(+)